MFGVISWLLQGQYKVRQQNLDRVNNVLQEDFSGVRVIKAFVRKDYENNRFKGVNEKFRAASLSPLRYQCIHSPRHFPNPRAVPMPSLSGSGVLQVIAGTMGVGEIIAFTQYFFFILAQSVDTIVCHAADYFGRGLGRENGRTN